MINFANFENYTRQTYLQRLRHGVAQERRQRQQPVLGKPDRKFMIFGQGRTGSTLMTSLLSSHPQIFCDEEIFFYPRLFPYAYAERRAGCSNATAYGFKVKIYQIPDLLGKRVARFLDRFERMGYKIIYLQRKNVVLHSFSSHFALEAKAYHFKEGDTDREIRFQIAPETFIELCDGRMKHLENETRHLAGRDHLHITYEDDLQQSEGGWGALSGKITPFLGVAPDQLTTPLRKSVQKPPSFYLENVDEIYAALKKTSFAEHADSLYQDAP